MTEFQPGGGSFDAFFRHLFIKVPDAPWPLKLASNAQIASLSTGETFTFVGADSLELLAAGTNRIARWGFLPHDLAVSGIRPFIALMGFAGSSPFGTLAIGGGTSRGYAVNEIQFWLAGQSTGLFTTGTHFWNMTRGTGAEATGGDLIPNVDEGVNIGAYERRLRHLYARSIAGLKVASVSATGQVDSRTFLELVNASAGAITRTLPGAANEGDGRMVTLKKVDSSANVVTIEPASGTIDGAASISLTSQYQSRTFLSDGTNYHIVAGYL